VTLDNPTGTVAGLTTNTTGTYADVDNGETLTLGTFAGPSAGTEGSPWSIGLSFPTPAGIINGTDLQAFWILAAQTYPWPSKLPTITVDLYESGVFRQSLGTRTIRAADTEGGQVMCFPFDAANLSVSSGANIEVKISSTPRSNLSYVKVYSVVLATDRDARAGDSGWLTYTPFEGSGITYRPEVDGPGNVILYEFPTTYNPYYVHLHIRSSRSRIETSKKQSAGKRSWPSWVRKYEESKRSRAMEFLRSGGACRIRRLRGGVARSGKNGWIEKPPASKSSGVSSASASSCSLSNTSSTGSGS
jgi:hypothetical protein